MSSHLHTLAALSRRATVLALLACAGCGPGGTPNFTLTGCRDLRVGESASLSANSQKRTPTSVEWELAPHGNGPMGAGTLASPGGLTNTFTATGVGALQIVVIATYNDNSDDTESARCTIIVSEADPPPDDDADAGDDGDVPPEVTAHDAPAEATEAVTCVAPQTVTFEDGELGAGWSESLTSTSPAGSTFAAKQAPTGGNPGAYRSFDLSNEGQAGSVCVVSLAGETFDPSVGGVVESLTMRFDAATPGSAGSSLQTAFSPLVKQGDALYWVGSDRLFVRAEDGWTARSWERDALRAFPSQEPGSVPDWGGAPLELGLLVCVSGARVDSGIDNWSVTITSCP